MKRSKHAALFAAVILLLAAIPAVLWLSHRLDRNSVTQLAADKQSNRQNAESRHAVADPPQRETTTTREASSLTSESSANEPGSIEELVAFLKSEALAKSADQLYAEIVKMDLVKSSWWRVTTDFSELLALACDTKHSEDTRIVSLRLYLAGLADETLLNESDQLQASFSDASDVMVSALMQDLADRKIPPRYLVLSTLRDQNRGQDVRCLAWNTARHTDFSDKELIMIALSESETGRTVSSKVAFDYLATTTNTSSIIETPSMRAKLDGLVQSAMQLPATAEIIEMANADAFIIAIPNLLESVEANQNLLQLLHNAYNPEMRISALQQIVKRHLRGADDLGKELAAVRKNLIMLFPDDSNRLRATAILSRIPSTKEAAR